MVLHTIGLLDGPWYPNPWLDKYIFPGGQLPALSEIVPAIERAGLIVTEWNACACTMQRRLPTGDNASWRGVRRRDAL